MEDLLEKLGMEFLRALSGSNENVFDINKKDLQTAMGSFQKVLHHPLHSVAAPPPQQKHKSQSQSSSEVQCPVDVREMETFLMLYFELPGVQKTDVTLTFEDDALVLTASKFPYSVGSDIFHVKERYQGSISKRVHLPCRVNKSSIVAKMNEGVLEVKIKKYVDIDFKQIVIE
jgi:HSP20 family molecular chaperone IbpA